MALINWSDKYSVGVATFDEDHKQLVAMINELHAAMSAGAAQQALGGILEKLAAYADTHFVAEEKSMDKYAVPGLKMHQVEHQNLRSQVGRFLSGIQGGKIAMSVRVLEFLRSWLIDHIQTSDKRYGPYLADKAL